MTKCNQLVNTSALYRVNIEICLLNVFWPVENNHFSCCSSMALLLLILILILLLLLLLLLNDVDQDGVLPMTARTSDKSNKYNMTN